MLHAHREARHNKARNSHQPRMYTPGMALALVFGGLCLFLAYTWRANELFCISVRHGKLLIVRGRVPQQLYSDFEDVLLHTRDALLTAQKVGGRARLSVTGADAQTAQRLRNLLSLCSQAQFRSAKVVAGRNLGQRLGSVWLAWKLR